MRAQSGLGRLGFGTTLFAALAVGAIFAGCSSNSSDSSPGPSTCTPESIPTSMCNPASCAAKNVCVCSADGKSAGCKLGCAAQTDCPFDYICNNASPANYCQAMTGTPITKKDKGQWGYACNASGGESNNPDCDGEQGFGCWGKNPTDGNAFCTTIGACTADTDCPGGWWCATVNSQPNVTTVKPKFGSTRPVCLPRAYCSPCESDHDCPLSANGLAQRCYDSDGNGTKFCTTECADTTNCAPDAKCNGDKVCYPNANVCLGDGTFCMPCRSDDDCAKGNQGGYCLESPYSHERFCGAKSKTACVQGQPATGCPSLPSGAKAKKVGCDSASTDVFAPKDQCFGFVTLNKGASGQYGCWVPNQ